MFISNQTALCTNTSGEAIGLLREKFPGRVISRNGDYNWPPRSCDLTTLDFVLWGYVNDKVYGDTPQSIQELKKKIRAIIDEIVPQMCENAMENFMKRAWSCKRSRGGYINDIAVVVVVIKMKPLIGKPFTKKEIFC